MNNIGEIPVDKNQTFRAFEYPFLFSSVQSGHRNLRTEHSVTITRAMACQNPIFLQNFVEKVSFMTQYRMLWQKQGPISNAMTWMRYIHISRAYIDDGRHSAGGEQIYKE